MAMDKYPRRMVDLLKRLGSGDSEVRYVAFLEADALSDVDMVAFAAHWQGVLPKKHTVTTSYRLAWCLILALFFASAGLYALAPMLAVGLVVVGLLLVAGITYRQVARGRPFPVARDLARLLARRPDVRFMDASVCLYGCTDDALTRAYLSTAFRDILPLIKTDDSRALRVHERFLAKILLRPLRDTQLTIGVLAAFEVAASRRALAYVRALGFVFEQDIEAFEREDRFEASDAEIDQSGERERLLAETEIAMGVGRERFIASSGMRSRDSEYIPRLGHLDGPDTYVRPPTLDFDQIGDLRRIAEAARRCEKAMEARLQQEEHASSLLHPTSAPTAPHQQLVRPLRGHQDALDDLLRPHL